MMHMHSAGDRSVEELRGAVVVGLIPGQNPRVVQEAARFAKLFCTSVVVASVDMPRYATFEDPTGMTASIAPEVLQAASQADVEAIELEVSEALTGAGVQWALKRLHGEPSRAIGELAEQLDANLIVVGTRRPGLGETLREFFNGSVAARLAHKQPRSVLVVPNGEGIPADLDD